MSRRPAMTSNHDNQYGAGYDALIAANPPQIVWRVNNRGIQVAVSVYEPQRQLAPKPPELRQSRGKNGTHCRRGHERTDENTYIAPSGALNCRKCKSERQREQRATERHSLVLEAMEAEAAEVAERFRKHHADNTSLMQAVRREI